MLFRSLGIVGDAAHDGGYHHGWDQRRISNGVLKDYSWQESPRDWNHKSNAARAIDVGMFSRLREMSVWIAGQCELNRLNPAVATDTADIRSVIYSPDGKVVVRWDRLGLRGSGDSSHLGHTHFSFFADAEHNAKVALFQRFFEGEMDLPKIVHQQGQGWWLVGNGAPEGMETEDQIKDLVKAWGPVVEIADQRHFGIPPKPPVPVPVTLTEAQLRQLAGMIKQDVLVPLADAAEAEAEVLRSASEGR